QDPDERISQIGPQHSWQNDRDDDEYAAHSGRARLGLMRFGTLFPNMLADLKLAQASNQPRTENQADQQRGDSRISRPKREVAENVQNAKWSPVLPERVEEFVEECIQHYASTENAARKALSASSSFTPRDPLMRIRSPFLTV